MRETLKPVYYHAIFSHVFCLKGERTRDFCSRVVGVGVVLRGRRALTKRTRSLKYLNHSKLYRARVRVRAFLLSKKRRQKNSKTLNNTILLLFETRREEKPFTRFSSRLYKVHYLLIRERDLEMFNAFYKTFMVSFKRAEAAVLLRGAVLVFAFFFAAT